MQSVDDPALPARSRVHGPRAGHAVAGSHHRGLAAMSGRLRQARLHPSWPVGGSMTAYVSQPNSYGCAIAYVAMIVGKTYDEMEAWFLEQGLARERMEAGIYDVIWREALDRHGFTHVQRYRCDPFRNRCDRSDWPPAPFAPTHICCADVAAGSHAVVMLADGAVLDPFKRERTSLAHPDYLQ